jgi:Zn-dependent peptidase ImmA (M78 family)
MESASSPVEKLANLIIKRYSLKPGFDIKEFLATQADLRFGEIPSGIDGISINLKSKDKRPIVIISSRLPQARQRFTMAHELGHIVIPWHIGTIFSHTDENHGYTSRLYQNCEIEANKFAAELLMPSQWVESMLNNQHPADAFEAIRKITGTSYIATFYKIGSKISTEYIGVLTDSREIVVNAISNNPRLKKPENNKSINEQAVFRNATEIRSSTHVQNKFFWLKYSKDVVAPIDNDPRTWREILYPIIEELKLDKKLGPRISGCISNLNKPGVVLEEFFLKARQRIASDNNFFEVSKHPDFELFLVKRIAELISNRKKS